MYQTLEYTPTFSTNKMDSTQAALSLHRSFEECASPKLLTNGDAGEPNSFDFLEVDTGLY